MRLIAALVLAPTLASADDHAEVNGNLVVASETSSPSSAGHVGGQLTLLGWFDRIALEVEVGATEWTFDSSLQWAGIGARVALYDSSTCGRECAGFRLWADVGMAHERWVFDQVDLEPTERERNAKHVGIGA